MRLRSRKATTGPDVEPLANPELRTGPIFANSVGKPLSLGSLVNRIILPALNRCEACGESEFKHPVGAHAYTRDNRIPERHGWHAARRGLASNLYRLGVPDMVIQRILRHANVSTTATYYIKTAAQDVRSAMDKLQERVSWANASRIDAPESSGRKIEVISNVQ